MKPEAKHNLDFMIGSLAVPVFFFAMGITLLIVGNLNGILQGSECFSLQEVFRALLFPLSAGVSLYVIFRARAISSWASAILLLIAILCLYPFVHDLGVACKTSGRI
jgi:hypothetical protein